jgi:hypothetical protein
MPDTQSEHPKLPLFKQEKPDSQKIWRYLNFEHFVDLISTKTLYFARTDRVDDPLEGLVTDATVDALSNGIPWANDTAKFRAIETFKQVIRKATNHVFINCWHMDDIESMALWKIYAQKGIAIHSTIGNLKNAITEKDFDMHFAEVEYIDESAVFPLNNIQMPYGRKRKSFEYEKEFRAIHLEMPPIINGVINYEIPNPNMGLRVPIDIGQLIKQVYIFPHAPQWFYDCTESVMEKYDVSAELKKSQFTIALNY